MNKKLKLFVIFFIFAVLAGQSHAKSTNINCTKSEFDGGATCSSKLTGITLLGTHKNSGFFVSVGGIYNVKQPDNYIVSLYISNMWTVVNRVSFNIDGVIETFTVYPIDNDIESTGYYKATKAKFVVPKEYMAKITKAKDVKVRISTVQDGVIEGSFFDKNGKELKPLLLLRELYTHTAGLSSSL